MKSGKLTEIKTKQKCEKSELKGVQEYQNALKKKKQLKKARSFDLLQWPLNFYFCDSVYIMFRKQSAIVVKQQKCEHLA